MMKTIDRFFTKTTPYLAALSALLMFHDATRADYAGAFWNFIWCLALFKLHLDHLNLDRDRWLIGIDFASAHYVDQRPLLAQEITERMRAAKWQPIP